MKNAIRTGEAQQSLAPRKAPILEDGKTLDELIGCTSGPVYCEMIGMREDGYTDQQIWDYMART